jgi:hypothetical protein
VKTKLSHLSFPLVILVSNLATLHPLPSLLPRNRPPQVFFLLFSLHPNQHSIYHKMGRLSTAVASVGVDAGNLPEKLPTISLWDALLPGSWSRKKVGRPHAIIACRPLRLIHFFPRMFSAHSHAQTTRMPNPRSQIPTSHSPTSLRVILTSTSSPQNKQKNINNSLSLSSHHATSHPPHHHQTCLSSSSPSSASPSSSSQ